MLNIFVFPSEQYGIDFAKKCNCKFKCQTQSFVWLLYYFFFHHSDFDFCDQLNDPVRVRTGAPFQSSFGVVTV